MTTIETQPHAAEGGAVTACVVGAAQWATTTDHKRIGRLYAGVGLLSLIAAATLGVVLGLERADDSASLVDPDALLQLFQSYRVALVFAVAAPMSIGLSVAITPLQLGARSIAFPRLALTGFYGWLGGLALTMIALGRNGGIGGGDGQAVEMYLVGLGLMALGLLATAGSVATSVLTTRAPGMTMRRVPLFAWSSLIAALGMLVALPVLFGAIVYVYIDNHYAQLNFGGAEGIVAWIGWMFSVPAVLIFAIPAVGVAAELFPVTFKHRQALRGVMFAGLALLGVVALSTATQQFVHDLSFDTDATTFVKAAVPFVLFAGLPLLGLVIVLALALLTARGGLAHGRPQLSAAFVFSLFGLLLIGVAIAANVLIGITDLELIGTSFEEGATLFAVYGSALALIGGLVLWAPKLWGRVLPNAALIPLALVGALGVVLAGGSLMVAGVLDQPGGMPASQADVAAILSTSQVSSGQVWPLISLIGHALVALAVLAVGGLLVKAVLSGEGDDLADNPVGGHTAEWGTASPAPAHNYEYVQTVASAEPQFDKTYEGSLS